MERKRSRQDEEEELRRRIKELEEENSELEEKLHDVIDENMKFQKKTKFIEFEFEGKDNIIWSEIKKCIIRSGDSVDQITLVSNKGKVIKLTSSRRGCELIESVVNVFSESPIYFDNFVIHSEANMREIVSIVRKIKDQCGNVIINDEVINF